MSKVLRIFLLICLVCGSLAVSARPAASADIPLPPPTCGSLGGELVPFPVSGSEVCIWYPTPVPSYGDVVIFAHGYVPPVPNLDAFYSQLILPGGNKIHELVTKLGYVFITTSYRKNGLAVKEGVQDIINLAIEVKKDPRVRNIYLIGGSEGGLITTLVAEKDQSLIKAGLAMCGPVGDFTKQVNYFGDARVVFDYFFRKPNGSKVIPGSPVAIPPEVMAAWQPGPLPETLPNQIIAALAADPNKTKQYLNVTGIPVDPNVPNSMVENVLGVLWYNIFATNESRVELFGDPVNFDTNQGQPYSNRYKWYRGSLNDWLMNAKIERFSPDPLAIKEINLNYQTTGRLKIPLVTLHNLQDPADPYWHETLYNLKVLSAGTLSKHINIPINRVGHCNFTPSEAVFAFSLMLALAGEQLPLPAIQSALPSTRLQQEFFDLKQNLPDLQSDR